MQQSVSGVFKVFGDMLKKNPNNRLVNKQGQTGAQKILEKVLDGRSAVIGASRTIKFYWF